MGGKAKPERWINMIHTKFCLNYLECDQWNIGATNLCSLLLCSEDLDEHVLSRFFHIWQKVIIFHTNELWKGPWNVIVQWTAITIAVENINSSYPYPFRILVPKLENLILLNWIYSCWTQLADTEMYVTDNFDKLREPFPTCHVRCLRAVLNQINQI
jgi:hypothetical protein